MHDRMIAYMTVSYN